MTDASDLAGVEPQASEWFDDLALLIGEVREQRIGQEVDGVLIGSAGRYGVISVLLGPARATSPGRLKMRAAIPVMLMAARTGTAAFAARGGRMSSKNGCVEGGALVVGGGDCPVGPLQAEWGDPMCFCEDGTLYA